jgi:hypothetical protein
MSERNIEPELSDFFHRVSTPEPSARLRTAVADSRSADHTRGALHRRFATDSRVGLSLAALAASIVLSAGMLFVAYGRGGIENAGLADGATASPGASSSEMASASLEVSPTIVVNSSPSAAASPSPTRDPSATFGPAGKFVAVGATTIGPSYAVLLPDGRVLVSDGSAIQVFDPTTNQFGAVETLVAPHYRGTVAGLPDGTVLIAGGMDTATGNGLDTALTYDPASGQATPTGNLLQARFDQHALDLADGKVLLFGGQDKEANQKPLQTAEIYDPTTRQFTKTGSMVVSRSCATTVLMSDGKVLIAGGDFMTSATANETTAEVFDPTTGKFTATGSMSVGRACAAGALLPDGRVLVAGGDDKFTGVGTADVYDPTSGTFTRTGNMAIGRFSHCATTLADGRVLITGGLIEPGLVASRDPGILAVTDNSYLASAELYNPHTGKFTKIGPMLSRRVGHTATLLENGRVLLAGGNLDKTTAEVYVP